MLEIEKRKRVRESEKIKGRKGKGEREGIERE